MVGRELTESYPPRKDCIDKNDVVLELKNLTGNGDKNISLKLHRGEILGLGGLVEQGVQELAEMILEQYTRNLDRCSSKEKKSN